MPNMEGSRLTYLDVRENPAMQWDGTIGWLQPALPPRQKERYQCASLKYNPTGSTSFLFDDTYYDYAFCNCSNNFFGEPPLNCTNCFEIPHSVCDLYGREMHYDKGFWPVYSQETHLLLGFTPCQFAGSSESACNSHGNCTIAYNQPFTPCCQEGYDDRLCSKCKCSDEICYYARDGRCEICQKVQVWVIVISVLSLLLSFLAFFFVKSKLITVAVEIATLIFFLLLGVGEWWFLDIMLLLMLLNFVAIEESSTGVVKTFVFYLQTTSALSEKVWPGWISNIFSSMSWINFKVSGAECASPDIFHNEFYKFLSLMLIPVIIGVLVLFSYLALVFVQFLQNRNENPTTNQQANTKSTTDEQGTFEDEEASAHYSHMDFDSQKSLIPKSPVDNQKLVAKKDQILFFFLFFLHIAYFELDTLILENFQCETDSYIALDGRKPLAALYLEKTPWIPCSFSDQTYPKLFGAALAFAIPYLVGIPALFGVVLFQNRNNLEDDHVKGRYGFLYAGYKPNYFYYEAIWIFRRILLAIFVAVIPASSPFRSSLVLALLIVSLVAQIYLQPFTERISNILEESSLVIIIVTYVSSLALSTEEVLASQTFNILLMLANVCLFIFFLAVLLAPVAIHHIRKYRPSNANTQ